MVTDCVTVTGGEYWGQKAPIERGRLLLAPLEGMLFHQFHVGVVLENDTMFNAQSTIVSLKFVIVY